MPHSAAANTTQTRAETISGGVVNFMVQKITD
jgi:hypothetical protein